MSNQVSSVGGSIPTEIPIKKKCDICSATDKKILQCSQCHIANYCSPICQKKGWPKHKEVCHLVKGLEEQCKINANPFLPNYLQVEMPKQLKILELATGLLNMGYIEIATKYIEENTSDPTIRKKYFEAYARKMCTLDKNNYSKVLEQGPLLIQAGRQVRRTVVDQLCFTRHFNTAYQCAREENNPTEQSHLLEVVASALTLTGHKETALNVTKKIPDEGIKKDLNQMWGGGK